MKDAQIFRAPSSCYRCSLHLEIRAAYWLWALASYHLCKQVEACRSPAAFCSDESSTNTGFRSRMPLSPADTPGWQDSISFCPSTLLFALLSALSVGTLSPPRHSLLLLALTFRLSGCQTSFEDFSDSTLGCLSATTQVYSPGGKIFAQMCPVLIGHHLFPCVTPITASPEHAGMVTDEKIESEGLAWRRTRQDEQAGPFVSLGRDHSRVRINFCILLFLKLVPSFSLNMSRTLTTPRSGRGHI